MAGFFHPFPLKLDQYYFRIEELEYILFLKCSVLTVFQNFF